MPALPILAAYFDWNMSHTQLHLHQLFVLYGLSLIVLKLHALTRLTSNSEIHQPQPLSNGIKGMFQNIIIIYALGMLKYAWEAHLW